MDEAKIREVLSDEEYVKELLAMDSEEQVQASLEEKGIEISLDEIRQVGDMLRKVASGEISQETAQRMANGELTEDELEEVAGGVVDPVSIIVGAIIGAVVFGFTTGGIISSFINW